MKTFHRRRLPHYQSPGQAIFVTWRLHGSLPRNLHFPSGTASGRAFLAMDRQLDTACTGPLFLRMPAIAELVMEAIRYRDQLAYQLHAFVGMPNHVHLLITPLETLSKLMQSVKRFTGRERNRVLCRTGQPFWKDEGYDRQVRNETEFERIVQYIERNSVTAGLSPTAEEFPWSSTGRINNPPQVDNLHHNSASDLK